MVNNFCQIKLFPQPACLGGSFWLILRTWFLFEAARLGGSLQNEPARLGGSFNIEKIGKKSVPAKAAFQERWLLKRGARLGGTTVFIL